jgi:hypothetical protein
VQALIRFFFKEYDLAMMHFERICGAPDEIYPSLLINVSELMLYFGLVVTEEATKRKSFQDFLEKYVYIKCRLIN